MTVSVLWTAPISLTSQRWHAGAADLDPTALLPEAGSMAVRAQQLLPVGLAVRGHVHRARLLSRSGGRHASAKPHGLRSRSGSAESPKSARLPSAVLRTRTAAVGSQKACEPQPQPDNGLGMFSETEGDADSCASANFLSPARD